MDSGFKVARRRVLLGGVAAIAAVAVPGAAGGAGARADATTPRAVDQAATASVLARRTGDRVQVLDQTSKRAVVIANPDGTFTARLSAGPVREPDPSSATGWTAIDTTLSDVGSTVQPVVTDAPMTFSDGGAGALATLTAGSGSVTERWAGTLPTPVLAGSTATYRDVYPGIDLVLRAETDGFEQSWVIKQRPDTPLTLDVPLSLKGLHAVEAARHRRRRQSGRRPGHDVGRHHRRRHRRARKHQTASRQPGRDGVRKLHPPGEA